MIAPKLEPMEVVAEEHVQETPWSAEITPMCSRIEFPKIDAFIDWWLSEAGLIAIEVSNPPISLPYFGKGWDDYNIESIVTMGASWDLWFNNAIVREVVSDETKDNTAIVNAAAVDKFNAILLRLNLHIASDACPRALKTTAPDPSNFYVFAYNPVDIRDEPTAANVKFLAVCCSAKGKRKRIAGVSAALACESRSRNKIVFTKHEAWARDMARDPNWKDIFSRLTEPEHVRSTGTATFDSQLLEFLPVAQQRRARVAFGLNGKIPPQPPVIDALSFPAIQAEPAAKRRAGTPGRSSTPRVPFE